MRHAPTPWKIVENDDGLLTIRDNAGGDVFPMIEADTRYIVHCVNAYDTLVEVASEWLDCLNRGIVCGVQPGSMAHTKLRQALDLAKKGEHT